MLNKKVKLFIITTTLFASSASAEVLFNLTNSFPGYFDGPVSGANLVSLDHTYTQSNGLGSMTYNGVISGGYHSFSFGANREINGGSGGLGGRVDGDQTFATGDRLTFGGVAGSIDVTFKLNHSFSASTTNGLGYYGDFAIDYYFWNGVGSSTLGSNIRFFDDPDSLTSTTGLVDTISFNVNSGDEIVIQNVIDFAANVFSSSVIPTETSVNGTFDIYISSITSGATVSSESGRDYLTATAIPEPSVSNYAYLGLIVVMLFCKRSFRKREVE